MFYTFIIIRLDHLLFQSRSFIRDGASHFKIDDAFDCLLWRSASAREKDNPAECCMQQQVCLLRGRPFHVHPTNRGDSDSTAIGSIIILSADNATSNPQRHGYSLSIAAG
jgi:hypothetical protein